MKNSQRLATHFYGSLVHWMKRIVNVPVFTSCQNNLTSGVSIHMVATNLTTHCLAWDLETNLLIIQCSIYSDPAVSCELNKHIKEDLSANMTKNVHDRAPLYQSKTC